MGKGKNKDKKREQVIGVFYSGKGKKKVICPHCGRKLFVDSLKALDNCSFCEGPIKI